MVAGNILLIDDEEKAEVVYLLNLNHQPGRFFRYF